MIQSDLNPELRRMGDIAKVREFISKINSILSTVEDKNIFQSLDRGEIEPLINSLKAAKGACSNMLLDLGCGMEVFEVLGKPHEPGDLS
jgi:hypothetical protein